MTTLQQNLIKTPFTLKEDFEDHTEWSALQGSPTIDDDAVHYKTGTQSVKISSLSAGYNLISKTVSWNLSSSHDQILFWVYADKDCGNDGFDILLAADAGFTEYFRYIKPIGLEAGWNILNIMASEWTANGGMTWVDTIIRIGIRYQNGAGINPALSFDSFQTGGETYPAISFQFDDGWDGAINYAYPKLNGLGRKSTVLIISDLVGTAGYMTSANLQTLDTAGWTVANHTRSHTHLPDLSEAEQEEEINDCDTALNGWGINAARRKHVGYPNAEYNADTLTAMTNTGMSTGRAGGGLAVPLLPPIDNRLFWVQHQLNNTVSLATAEGYVDAIKARREVSIIVLHDLVDGSPGINQWDKTDFEDLIDYCIANEVYLLSQHDLYLLESGSIEYEEACVNTNTVVDVETITVPVVAVVPG